MFVLVAVMLPLAAVFGIEGTLRLFGYGGYPQTVLKVGRRSGVDYYLTNPAAPRSYFNATLANAGAMHESAFCMPKPKETLRVVLAGGSAVRGTPYPTGLTAAAFLQAMLKDALPGKRVEVINLGTTAVATFPVFDMLTRVLPYDVDLVIVYAGHNEFFGAGGVASRQHGGTTTAALRRQRWIGSLGIVQFATRRDAPAVAPESRTLMESVAARGNFALDDPLRARAAENLQANVTAMIRACQTRGIPIMVCALAANERSLVPIGAEDLAISEPATLPELRRLAETNPDSARLRYRIGQALWDAGQRDEAGESFRRARDLDRMPWRAPSTSNDALRRAAIDTGALWCDVEAAFRKVSPGGACGAELFDDHVHFSLNGQALLARTWVEALTSAPPPITVSRERFAALPDTRTYFARLGVNVFSLYHAAHLMCLLYDISFMRDSNPQALARFRALRDDLESKMTPETRPLARQWQTPAAPGMPKRSLTALAGYQFMIQQQFQTAETLFREARREAAPFSSWSFADTFAWLQCRKLVEGTLDEGDLRTADETIARIEVLAAADAAHQNEADDYLGRLYHLRGAYGQAIPHLQAAHQRAQGAERVRVDKALIESYVNVGQREAARRIAQAGEQQGGPFAKTYALMKDAIPRD